MMEGGACKIRVEYGISAAELLGSDEEVDVAEEVRLDDENEIPEPTMIRITIAATIDVTTARRAMPRGELMFDAFFQKSKRREGSAVRDTVGVHRSTVLRSD